MEDQGKRILLAVAAAFGIMLVWGYLFPPTPPAPKDSSAEVAPDASSSAELAAKDAAEPPEMAEPSPTVARGQEQQLSFTFERFGAELSSYGASLSRWELLGDKYRDANRDGPIQLVGAEDAESLRPLAISFTPTSTVALPEYSEWQVASRDERSVTFVWASEALRVTKKFEFEPEHFLIEMSVEIENLSSQKIEQGLVISLYAYQDPSVDTGGGWGQPGVEWKAACALDDELETRSQEEFGEDGPLSAVGKLRWGGFDHTYFLAATALQDDAGSATCAGSAVQGRPGQMQVDVTLPVTALAPGESTTKTFLSFYGPKYFEMLEVIDTARGTDFEAAVDLGEWLGVIGRPLLWLLQWFYSFVGNYGIAIILLTVCVKLATLYWATKSMRSMKSMARLRPQIEVIQKKYKDDRQRQQVEIMSMYKEHGVNPVAGCLPMVLQMPIWFALYRMLANAAELYRAPFIPGWIDDLTATDPYYVLPIAVMAMMFAQAKLSPATADSTQQKVMTYGLPLVFGMFSFVFPAGLVLYIFTNTLLSAVHHLWMNRTGEPQPKRSAPVDASPTAVVGNPEVEASERPHEAPVTRTPSRKRPSKAKRSGKKKR